MVGGNRATAWLAGINTDRYLIAAFVLSGVTAAIGGVVSVLVSTAATLKLGENSLMYVISATIIGGTAMSGGKGGVLRSVVAIMSLEMLYTGIILFGLGNEVKIFFAGLILAYVVLYEAYAVYRHDKTLGQRPELMKELAERPSAAGHGRPRAAKARGCTIGTTSGRPPVTGYRDRGDDRMGISEGGSLMKRLPLIVAALALAALVLTPAFGLTAAQQANLKASLAVDTSVLKSADGQQLLAPSTDNRKVPMRPADPNKLSPRPIPSTGTTWSGRAGTSPRRTSPSRPPTAPSARRSS